MPIDIEAFNEGDPEELNELTNAERVIRFLFENRDQAFTPSEIAARTSVKRNSIGTVLSRLEEKSLVRHKGDYWAIGDLERVQSAYRTHKTIEMFNDLYGKEDPDEWRKHAAEQAEK
ncbi:TrmB family transcriptional regulator [Natrialbaceae archaeon A-arb3/5]